MRSDESVGNLERDEFVGEVYELGLIVFTTYQSSDKLAAAARLANMDFDLAILDEAHKTVGVRSKTFAMLLRDRNLKVRHRLSMTATERVFRGDSDEVLSMDNEDDYSTSTVGISRTEQSETRRPLS